MKKILILGANSALAKDTIKHLKNDYEIVTAGRNFCDIKIDISEEFIIPSNIDIVINYASSFGFNTDEEMQTAVKTNIMGTLNICQSSKKANVKHLILFSSMYTKLQKDSPYYTMYAITKRHADEIALHYCKQNNINLTIIKPSQIFGENEAFSKNQPLFSHIMKSAKRGEDINIFGKNDAQRNYIYSGDIAKITKKIISKQIFGEYDCIFPTNITLSKIAKYMQNHFKVGGKISFDETKPNIKDNIFKYDDNLYIKISYTPQTTISNFLEDIKC